MASLFTESEISELRKIHVNINWFVELTLPSGIYYFHSGAGKVVVEGKTWQGVTNPLVGQIASIGQVEAVRLGTIPVVDIVIVGINSAFMQSVRDLRSEIQGKSCKIYWGMFNPELETIIGSLKLLFDGKLTSAALMRDGISGRYITLSLEGPTQALRYPYSWSWNPAQLRYRNPNDAGFDFMGAEFEERIT